MWDEGRGFELLDGTSLHNISSELQNSLVADKINRACSLMQYSNEQLYILQKKREENISEIKKDFLIWSNSFDSTLVRKLFERPKIKLKLSETQDALNKLIDPQYVDSALSAAAARAEEIAAPPIRKCVARMSDLQNNPSKLDPQGFSLMSDKVRALLNSKQIGITRTGSDGKFSIPSKARYLSCMGKHRDDLCLWLIKINMDEPVVILTNSNMKLTNRNAYFLDLINVALQ
jgi:hypothetical protein